ncbi:MAG: DUF6435 family protein [Bacteroidota bacterium]
MLGLFKKDPLKKLVKQYEAKMEEARDVQRSGDLKKYAKIIDESEVLAKQIDELRKS